MKCKIFSGRGVQDQVNKFLESIRPEDVKRILQSTSTAKLEYASYTMVTITIFYEE